MNDMKPHDWPMVAGQMAELVRAHDWMATPLGSLGQWPQNLRTTVDICLASGFPTFVWWGPELIQLYNDAALAKLRDKHPGAFATPAREAWRDIWSEVQPLVERVLRTGEPVAGEDTPISINRGGSFETSYFTFDFSALRDEAGAIAGLFVTCIETTAKVRAEAARRQSELRLRELSRAARLSSDFQALFEAAPTPFLVLAPADLRIVAVNDAYLRAIRMNREAILNHLLFEVFPEHPDNPYVASIQNLRATLEQVIATGRTHLLLDQRYPISRPAEAGGGFEEHWWNSINTPVLGQDGGIALIIHGIEDVTERRAAEEALRESEERYRRIVESARDYAILIISTEGRITDWLPGAEAVFGRSTEEVLGEPLSIIFTPEDRESGVPELEMRLAAAEGSAPDVRWHQRKDGTRVFIEGAMMPLHDRDGSISGYLKIGQDVTDRKRAEEHQRTLVNELQHRVRNILAMIRSVVRRTARSSESVAEYSRHLEGRISAMVRTQALLTRDPGAGVDLQNLILDELQAQAAADNQFSCDGADILLAPRAAEVLTLAIHELATNSVKYGALSRTNGKVEVRWAIETREDEPWIRLIWREGRERGTKAPKHHGFGTELITRRVPYELRGHGSIEFKKDKIIATIEFPLGHADSMLQTHASGIESG